MKMSLNIMMPNSLSLSPHLAGGRYFTSLSLLSLFHPLARISPCARVYARVCERGVKEKEGEKYRRMRVA